MPVLLPLDATTFLTLSAMGVPPYSARDVQTTLAPIDGAGNLVRDWNGVLLDLSIPNFQKYRMTIQGSDVQPPAIDKVWPGLLCTIGWPKELAYATGLAGAPGRTVVTGSSRVEGAFTFYRPSFACRITNFEQDDAEWGASTDWTIEAEEV